MCACVSVQRLRALCGTGAIKDTLKKERDYRKNIITHINGVFFLSEKNKKTNLCGREKQQSKASHDASTEKSYKCKAKESEFL